MQIKIWIRRIRRIRWIRWILQIHVRIRRIRVLKIGHYKHLASHLSLSSVFITSTLIIGIFYCLNYYFTIFESRRIQTQRYGVEFLAYIGQKIWSKVPNDIKESASLAVFKNKIKNWTLKLCPCKLYKTYMVNLGHL